MVINMGMVTIVMMMMMMIVILLLGPRIKEKQAQSVVYLPGRPFAPWPEGLWQATEDTAAIEDVRVRYLHNDRCPRT